MYNPYSKDLQIINKGCSGIATKLYDIAMSVTRIWMYDVTDLHSYQSAVLYKKGLSSRLNEMTLNFTMYVQKFPEACFKIGIYYQNNIPSLSTYHVHNHCEFYVHISFFLIRLDINIFSNIFRRSCFFVNYGTISLSK